MLEDFVAWQDIEGCDCNQALDYHACHLRKFHVKQRKVCDDLEAIDHTPNL